MTTNATKVVAPSNARGVNFGRREETARCSIAPSLFASARWPIQLSAGSRRSRCSRPSPGASAARSSRARRTLASREPTHQPRARARYYEGYPTFRPPLCALTDALGAGRGAMRVPGHAELAGPLQTWIMVRCGSGAGTVRHGMAGVRGAGVSAGSVRSGCCEGPGRLRDAWGRSVDPS